MSRYTAEYTSAGNPSFAWDLGTYNTLSKAIAACEAQDKAEEFLIKNEKDETILRLKAKLLRNEDRSFVVARRGTWLLTYRDLSQAVEAAANAVVHSRLDILFFDTQSTYQVEVIQGVKSL